MTAPVTPQSRAPTLEPHPVEPANESAFPGENAPKAKGWDPYEVWRTRVFAARPTDKTR